MNTPLGAKIPQHFPGEDLSFTFLEEGHLGRTAVSTDEIDPHPVLYGAFLFLSIDHLNPGLIPKNISAPEKFPFHEFIERLRIPIRVQDNPVRHSLLPA